MLKRILIVLSLAVLVWSGNAVSEEKFVLPPVTEDPSRLSTVGKVYVDHFQLEGNTVFSDAELKAGVASFEKREITAEELQEVKNILTKHYIDRGYVNSGAIIPDQSVGSGVIKVTIIEGRLVKTEITGTTWLRESYVKKRIDMATTGTLNIITLQERLKLIKQDPRIDNVNAELGPGLRLGEAELRVEIDEAKPYQVTLDVNNHNSPSIGPYRGDITVSHIDLTGWGDALVAGYGITEGLDDYFANYTVPLTRWDTTFSVGIDRSESTVVAKPFDQLDIRSETTTYSASLRHPLIKTVSQELALGLKFEKREGKTWIFGDDSIDFTTGTPNGKSKLSILRFSQEWLDRSLFQVIAVRSTFSLGIDMWDATIKGQLVENMPGSQTEQTYTSEPDGEFFSWLGQFQWLRRIDALNSQVLFRTDLRLSNDPVLPMEKFAIGGSSTVRGYRENQMTTDNGVVTSLEMRIPIFKLKLPWLSKGATDGEFRLAPFFDYGRGWNEKDDDPEPEQLYGAGIGALWAINRKIDLAVYWGHAIEDDIVVSSDHDLQDDGFHFRLTAELF